MGKEEYTGKWHIKPNIPRMECIQDLTMDPMVIGTCIVFKYV